MQVRSRAARRRARPMLAARPLRTATALRPSPRPDENAFLRAQGVFMSVGESVAPSSSDVAVGEPVGAIERGLPRSLVVHVGAATAYGLLTHALFRASFAPRLNVMSAGFLFGAPFAIGAVAAMGAWRQRRFDWRAALLAPWLACFAVAAFYALFALEPLLCVVMAMPVLLVMSTLGGLAAQHVARRPWGSPRAPLALLAAVMLVPFCAGWAESFAPPPDSLRHVHTEIRIAADRDTIWHNITRVSAIQPSEQRFSIFHALGLPKPRQAILDKDGVGGVRDAMFEQGLSFIEAVTQWQRDQEMRFTIEIDHSKALPPLLAAIDSSYFRVLDGRYAIQPLPDGSCILYLDSHERLSTRYNWYASLWTDGIMHHLQTYILRIIRGRCEAQASSGAHLATR